MAPCLATEARAEEGAANVAPARTLSAYEKQTIDEILAERGLVLESEPEGKLIEGVTLVRLEVFDEHDPIPDFLNVFHVTTLERVLRRELLFRSGEVYDLRRIDETARNLRTLRQLSLVLIVPVRGSSEGRVRVLVIAKDVWSLRANYDLALGNQGLSYLLLNPSEENFLGTHASVGGLFVLLPESYSLGLTVGQRRILGTHLEGRASANLIFNRHSGEHEGEFGYFAYGQPLYAIDRQWGWGTGVTFRNQTYRLYNGDQVKTFDADSTLGDDALRIEYRSERAIGGYELIRSFGREQKYDLSIGAEADRRHYRYDPPNTAAPQAVAEFSRTELPVTDTRISPFAQVRTYTTEFMSTIELETLGLQEDVRLGPSALLRLYPASRDVGSTRDLIGAISGVSYTLALSDGVLRAVGVSTIEYELHGNHDALAEGALYVASPRFGLGRLVVDGVVQSRYRNYLRRKFYLGGDGRLRGYGINQYYGGHLLALSTELRTRSVDILSAQVGLDCFWDAAHAADEFSALALKHSVGMGVRILFPQANREVFRFDWGLPLSLAEGPLPGGFFVTFFQAFPMPELRPPSVTNFVAD